MKLGSISFYTLLIGSFFSLYTLYGVNVIQGASHTTSSAESTATSTSLLPVGHSLPDDFIRLNTGIAQNDSDKVTAVLRCYPNKIPLFTYKADAHFDGLTPLAYATHCESSTLATLLSVLDAESTSGLIDWAIGNQQDAELEPLLEHTTTVLPGLKDDASYWLELINFYCPEDLTLSHKYFFTEHDPCLRRIFNHIKKHCSQTVKESLFKSLECYEKHLGRNFADVFKEQVTKKAADRLQRKQLGHEHYIQCLEEDDQQRREEENQCNIL